MRGMRIVKGEDTPAIRRKELWRKEDWRKEDWRKEDWRSSIFR